MGNVHKHGNSEDNEAKLGIYIILGEGEKGGTG